MRLLLTLLFVVCGLTSIATAQERRFTHSGLAKDAERYETFLRSNWQPGKSATADLKLAGDKSLASDPRAASRSYAMAVVADDKNAEAWIGLAQALLAIKADPDRGGERYDLPVNASGAAYRAYERAGDDAVKARALAVLGQALERRSYWRPALEALKISLALAENGSVRDTYEKLRTAHGFRMTDYKTESDASTPRLCAQFSEPLAREQTDFAKFVSVDGADPQNVSPEGSQLCIEGLTHGRRYEIKIRDGLPSDVGETLEKPIEIAVYVADRKPSVRFTGRSYVLPSRGQQGIPLVSVNTSRVAVEVFRVGDRNLARVLQEGELERQYSGYDLETLRSKTGERVYQGELDVTNRPNEDVTTAFPVSDAIGTLKPGAYAMVAKPAEVATEEYRNLATQWFIVSDLGLTALNGDDGIHAFVRSLADATPTAGASVRLVARNNEVLATSESDAKGYVRFEPGVSRGEGGLQPAILVAEKGDGEYAFLDLSTTAFDLTDRGVKGREAPGPIDGYLYTERGVYRPGETLNVTALVRDRAGTAAGLPVTLIIDRPDGVEHRRIALTDNSLGGRTAELKLDPGVMTGTWRAKLYVDPKDNPINQITFLVEDFVPERLDLTLSPADGAIKPAEPFSIKASGRYLYGPPAQDLALEGDIIVKPSVRDVVGYSGYNFGLADELINPVRQPLEALPKTGADGTAALAVQLPPVPKTARPLEATLLLRLRESGGRSIERSVTLPVDLGQPRIGIKPQFGKEGAPEGGTAGFDVVVLDGAGQRVAAAGLKWDLVRLDTNWQWYNRDGNWSYDAVTLTRKVAGGTLDAGTDAPARIEAPLDYGRYRLEIVSAQPDGPASSVTFNAGWHTGGETADSPEMLDVALDKASYAVGETAKLRIASKRGGKALVAVVSNGLLSAQEIELPDGGGEVPVPVGDGWGSGAYVATMLYRPMDETAKRMPARAIGLSWLGLDQSARTLGVGLGAPETSKSGTTLSVPVSVTGLAEGETAHLTVAAVDLGILNLTRFEPPAPERHFYAQTRLGLEIRDFYGRLIDGMRADRGTLRSGGDGDGLEIQGTPPVEDTVAFFSGIVKVGADGTAAVEFQLPDFNGTVRLMAVAWSKDKLGSSSQDVIVRDAVALTASAPRFLTLGDEAELNLSIHNVEGPASQYQVTIDEATTVGEDIKSVRLSNSPLDLTAGERKSTTMMVKPTAAGLHTYEVQVSGPPGITVRRQLALDVKLPAGDIKRTTVSQLAANGGKLTVTSDLLQDLVANRSRINLSVGPAASLDVPGLLSALDRYPYGCAEQTVSRALPLVYANAVAAKLGMATDTALKLRVQGAIDRVFQMQDSSGAFGTWGPSSPDLWLTSYVADFLTRAKEAGYVVPPQAFTQALDRLQNFVSYSQDEPSIGEQRAYALYVLARNARAPIGELRYWADTRLDTFATPLAKAQLGAALSLMGDKPRAESVLQSALTSLDSSSETAISRADYGSVLRDHAAFVTLAAETGVAKAEAPRLVNVIAKAYLTRTYTSTQEQAWMLLAAHALGDQAKSTALTVNGESHTGELVRSFSAADVKGGGVVVANMGDAPVDAVISVIGASLTPEPAIAKGFTIQRAYYRLNGEKVDLASGSGGSATLGQNERLVAAVTITAEAAGGRVLIVDRLPAGLEIENPKLIASGDIKSLDWLTGSRQPEHTEFRDDRFVAAFNFFATENSENQQETIEGDATGADPAGVSAPNSATVAYIVRAVSPGTFVHPAATVEDMYSPERYARTAAGRLQITAQQ